MARSTAETVDDYLDAMPPERREQLRPVLETIRSHLPPGYEEVMAWGMVAWQVPLERWPDTYNGKPLLLAALANQKSYLSLYLNSTYAIPELKRLLDDSGRPLRMGKSCINFRRADELPLDAVGEIVRRSDLATYVAAVQAAGSR